MKCVRTPLMTPNCVLQDFDKKTYHFYKQLISSALIVFTICLATKQSPMTSVEQGVLSVSHPHKGIPQKPGQPCYWGQCPDNGGKWRETRPHCFQHPQYTPGPHWWDFLRINSMPVIMLLTHCSINTRLQYKYVYMYYNIGPKMNGSSIIGDHRVQKRFKWIIWSSPSAFVMNLDSFALNLVIFFT